MGKSEGAVRERENERKKHSGSISLATGFQIYFFCHFCQGSYIKIIKF